MKYNPNETPQRGQYYKAEGTRLERFMPFEEAKNVLPQPFFKKRQDWLGCYNYAWSIAFKNAQRPSPESGFISDIVDAAFNQDFFLWDTVFITMFTDFARPYLPGIAALDNFYVKQLPNGEIARELVRETGTDVDFWVNFEGLPLHSYFHNNYGFRKLFKTPRPSAENFYYPDLQREQTDTTYYTLDNLNHPLLAWGELISYTQTADIERLANVFSPLLQQYKFMHKALQHKNGLYVTDWASMDNSPRNKDLCCGVDISCEMVLFADNLLTMMNELEKCKKTAPYTELRKQLISERDSTKEIINQLLWDEKTGFYYDMKTDGTLNTIKTAAAFWALAAGVADENQSKKLANWLEDESSFNRAHRLPVLAADEEGYNPNGGYWSGSVWAPMNTMVLYGLEKYGFTELANDIAINHLNSVTSVWKDTGTIWENYPADSISKGDSDHPDFVGWSGIGPIRYLLRYGVGLVPDAPSKKLRWNLPISDLENGEVGCRRFRFGYTTTNVTATLKNNEIIIKITSDSPYELTVWNGKSETVFRVKNEHEIIIEA